MSELGFIEYTDGTVTLEAPIEQISVTDKGMRVTAASTKVKLAVLRALEEQGKLTLTLLDQYGNRSFSTISSLSVSDSSGKGSVYADITQDVEFRQ